MPCSVPTFTASTRSSDRSPASTSGGTAWATPSASSRCWSICNASAQPGSSRRDVYALTLLVAIGVLLGGRVVEVSFDEWPFYREHPSLIPALWLGGMATHGLLIGAAVGRPCSAISIGSRCSKSPTSWSSPARSSWASGASATSSTARSLAAVRMCRGRSSSRRRRFPPSRRPVGRSQEPCC